MEDYTVYLQLFGYPLLGYCLLRVLYRWLARRRHARWEREEAEIMRDQAVARMKAKEAGIKKLEAGQAKLANLQKTFSKRKAKLLDRASKAVAARRSCNNCGATRDPFLACEYCGT
jgi:hypothetical protein